MKRDTLKNIYQSLRNTQELLHDAMIKIDDCIKDNHDAPIFELNHIKNKIHDTIIEVINLENGYAKLYHVDAAILLKK